MLFQAVILALAFGTPDAPATRLERSTSGPRGTVQGGRYVVEDPRSAFTAGVDRQVVVLFEWETAPGKHHCEASWRDPSGHVVLVSPADFEARGRRFSAYWSIALPDNPTLGLWAVEAIVDGQAAGVHTFQLASGAGAPSPARRLPLGPKETYARAMAATVSVEARGAEGEVLWTGSGFYLDAEHVVTAFQVIEGASSLHVIFPGAQSVDASAIAVANRRQDWAMLRTSPSGAVPLPPAASGSTSVGDVVAFLDVLPDGGRTLQTASVVGRHEVPGAGARIDLSAGATFAALGSPLLNEFGDLVGFMGGSTGVGGVLIGSGLRVPWGTIAVAPMAIPRELLSDPGSLKSETIPVGELLTRGIAAPPLSRRRIVMFGVVGRGEVTPRMGLTEERQLSRRDGAATVQITWDTTQKLDGETTFKVFDSDNRQLVASEVAKVKIRPGQATVSTWKLPLVALTPGVYRLDVSFSGEVAWRGYLTILD